MGDPLGEWMSEVGGMVECMIRSVSGWVGGRVDI